MITPKSTLLRLGRFAAVSAVSFPLNLLITMVVHEVLGLSEELSFAIALLTVFTFNFFAARHIIYRAAGGDPRRQLVRFSLASAGFRLTEYLGFIVVHALVDFHYLFVAGLVLGTSFFCKFFFYGNFVFTSDS